MQLTRRVRAPVRIKACLPMRTTRWRPTRQPSPTIQETLDEQSSNDDAIQMHKEDPVSRNESEVDETEKTNHKDVVIEEENAESAADDHSAAINQVITQAEDIEEEEQDTAPDNVEPLADQVCN